MERIQHDYADEEAELPNDAGDKSRLAAAMSDISETQYCASWLIDNEFNVWALVREMIPNHYGLSPVEQSKLDRVWELHQKTDGWVIWVGDEELAQFGIVVPEGEDPWNYTGRYFVTTAEWEPMFNAWARGMAAMGSPLRQLSPEEIAQREAEWHVSIKSGEHIFDFEGRRKAVEKFLEEKGWKPLEPFYSP